MEAVIFKHPHFNTFLHADLHTFLSLPAYPSGQCCPSRILPLWVSMANTLHGKFRSHRDRRKNSPTIHIDNMDVTLSGVKFWNFLKNMQLNWHVRMSLFIWLTESNIFLVFITFLCKEGWKCHKVVAKTVAQFECIDIEQWF